MRLTSFDMHSSEGVRETRNLGCLTPWGLSVHPLPAPLHIPDHPPPLVPDESYLSLTQVGEPAFPALPLACCLCWRSNPSTM